MGISIPQTLLNFILEKAVGIAESDYPLPEEWLNRTRRIGDCPSKSYVAALGTALLAKAADPKIDVLFVKAGAGSNAYSMRGVVRVLVERAAHYGYHLGVTRREPLNNQPWFRIDRVDEPVHIKANAKPYHRDLIRYLNDLNNLTAEEALYALAAFIRLRLDFAQHEREWRIEVPSGVIDLSKLIGAAEHFLRDDPEDGRRGQALVAAVLDLVHEEVELSAINDPTPLDVRVLREGRTILGVEVKQKPVGEVEALEIAEGAAQAGADKALLVALAEGQRPLSDERVRMDAASAHGVLAVVYVSVTQLIIQAVIASRLTANEFAEQLPARYMERLQEHEISRLGQQHWLDLVAGLHATE